MKNIRHLPQFLQGQTNFVRLRQTIGPTQGRRQTLEQIHRLTTSSDCVNKTVFIVCLLYIANSQSQYVALCSMIFAGMSGQTWSDWQTVRLSGRASKIIVRRLWTKVRLVVRRLTQPELRRQTSRIRLTWSDRQLLPEVSRLTRILHRVRQKSDVRRLPSDSKARLTPRRRQTYFVLSDCKLVLCLTGLVRHLPKLCCTMSDQTAQQGDGATALLHRSFAFPVILSMIDINVEHSSMTRLSFSIFVLSLISLLCFMNVIFYMIGYVIIQEKDYENKYPKFSRIIKFYKNSSLVYMVIEGVVCLGCLLILVIFSLLYLYKYQSV